MKKIGYFILIGAVWNCALLAGVADPLRTVTFKDTYASPEIHVPQPEAPHVVEVLTKALNAVAKGDIDSYASTLTDDSVLYDDAASKQTAGKQKVVEALTPVFAKAAKSKADRTILIERPYVKVSNDMAVVTYKMQLKEGAKKIEKLCTSIFVHDDKGAWKLSYDSGMPIIP